MNLFGNQRYSFRFVVAELMGPNEETRGWRRLRSVFVFIMQVRQPDVQLLALGLPHPVGK